MPLADAPPLSVRWRRAVAVVARHEVVGRYSKPSVSRVVKPRVIY